LDSLGYYLLSVDGFCLPQEMGEVKGRRASFLENFTNGKISAI
jgi:hypothetical protein